MLVQKYEWDNKRQTIKGACMRGITDVLKALFYPAYSFRKATKGTKLKLVEEKNKAKGKRLGKFLDKALGDYVNGDKIAKLPELSQLLTELKRKDLEIIHVQFPVADTDIRLCTCIDLIAYSSKDKTYYLIELKTGYITYKLRHTGQHMHSPLSFLTDAPLNQHFLQAWIGQKLFECTYPALKNVQSVVWYITPSSVQPYELPYSQLNPKWTQTRSLLIKSKNQTIQDRKNIKRNASACLTRAKKKQKQAALRTKIEHEIREQIRNGTFEL